MDELAQAIKLFKSVIDLCNISLVEGSNVVELRFGEIIAWWVF